MTLTEQRVPTARVRFKASLKQKTENVDGRPLLLLKGRKPSGKKDLVLQAVDVHSH